MVRRLNFPVAWKRFCSVVAGGQRPRECVFGVLALESEPVDPRL
jgi:hypothetical protein